MAEVSKNDAEKVSEWNEEKYEEAISKLQNVQDSIGNLRSTVPFMLETCGSTHRRPEELYGDFKSAATRATHGIQELKVACTQDEMKTLLEKAKDA